MNILVDYECNSDYCEIMTLENAMKLFYKYALCTIEESPFYLADIEEDGWLYYLPREDAEEIVKCRYRMIIWDEE